jgi:hypothetical protein
MTLWALVFLCAGNCAQFHVRAELVVDDCEQASLAEGMKIVTTEPVKMCDMGMCMDSGQTRPIKPRVIYTVCRQIALVAPPDPCTVRPPGTVSTCIMGRSNGVLYPPYPAPGIQTEGRH